MTPLQCVRFLMSDFEPAAKALKAEIQRLEALKGQKAEGWPVAECIGDYVKATGAPMSPELAARLRREVDRVVQKVATDKKWSPAAAWVASRPYFVAWCEDDDAPTYGPEKWSAHPWRWKPESRRADLGAYHGTVSRDYISWCDAHGGVEVLREKALRSGKTPVQWAIEVNAPPGTVGFLRL